MRIGSLCSSERVLPFQQASICGIHQKINTYLVVSETICIFCKERLNQP